MAPDRLPIAQMYHVATDNRIPYMVYGQMQDGMPLHGPSEVPGGGEIGADEWTTTAGCETGWNIPDPVDNNIVWGGCYAGVTERFDARSGFARSVSVGPIDHGRQRGPGEDPHELDLSHRDLAA